MRSVCKAWVCFVVRDPFHPFVHYPFIAIDDRASKMTDSRIKIVLSPYIKPI